MSSAGSRWACPECSGPAQVAIPSWYVERLDHELVYVEPDDGAAPLYWYCAACETSGDGRPIDRAA